MIKYYNILNLNQGASQKDIIKAYRKLSLKYHPDRKTGNKEKFQQINRAKSILLNNERPSPIITPSPPSPIPSNSIEKINKEINKLKEGIKFNLNKRKNAIKQGDDEFANFLQNMVIKMRKKIKSLQKNKKCLKKTIQIIKNSKKYKNLNFKGKSKLKKEKLCDKISKKKYKKTKCQKMTLKEIKKSNEYKQLKFKGKYKLKKQELCNKLKF